MKTKSLLSLIFAATIGMPVFGAAPTTVKHPEWAKNAVIYEVNTRQFTDEGSFAGVNANLDRLKDLGVDILWFMPIHPISEKNRKGELGSYYAVKDYKAVNPEFGTLADFKTLVDNAHARGMKVILDWVPNHTGCDNAWVIEHPDYYARNEKGDMYGPYDWTDVYKLDYSNIGTREAMIDAMSYWLTDVGVDGFRCDVAMEVPTDFWNDARQRLQALQPELFMLAEASAPDLEEHAFDMAYNWPMKDLFNAISANAGQYGFVGNDGYVHTPAPARASDIPTLVQRQHADFPLGAYLMNMITNHDLNSWEGTEFDRLGHLVPAFAVLTYTLPGMPLIYTGQEVGMNRPFEFFVKDEAPDWTSNDWTLFYTALNSLKHSRPELSADASTASMITYRTTSPDVLVFERKDGNSRTIVGVNLGAETQTVTFDSASPDMTNAKAVSVKNGGTSIPETLESGEYFIFTVN
ncbi:MAG: alpha-amylase [Muribaculaceae bacterium]|nr:alpha-amylase [Muribaculaceae bacterium]